MDCVLSAGRYLLLLFFHSALAAVPQGELIKYLASIGDTMINDVLAALCGGLLLQNFLDWRRYLVG